MKYGFGVFHILNAERRVQNAEFLLTVLHMKHSENFFVLSASIPNS